MISNRWRRNMSEGSRLAMALVGATICIIAIPLGLYIWLVWGWYEGAMLVYNSIANATGAGDFAWGIIKFFVGASCGAIIGAVTFLIGGFLIDKA
jgi:hypothetical protein